MPENGSVSSRISPREICGNLLKFLLNWSEWTNWTNAAEWSGKVQVNYMYIQIKPHGFEASKMKCCC